MRPATADDRPEIEALIRARGDWMRDRGMPGWRRLHDLAAELAGQAGGTAPVWAAIDEEADRIAGIVSLYDQASPLLWPDEEERNQPSIFLATAFTDPAYRDRRTGCLMAWWALDHAYHLGRIWVRRGTGPYPRLVDYYTKEQGWTLVKQVQHKGLTAYGFQRRAEPQPHLPELGMRLGIGACRPS